MLVAVVAASFFASGATAHTANPCTSVRAQIRALIAQIEVEKDSDDRVDKSLNFASYVQQHAACAQSREIVRIIVPLLYDDSDGVRESGAAALGFIGPAARSAVPDLKRAIAHSDALLDADPSTLLPSDYSGEVARSAIKKITGESVPSYQERKSKKMTYPTKD
jgi:HEAT repeat protein